MEEYKMVVVGAGLVGRKMVECLRKSSTFKNSQIKILATRAREEIIAKEKFEVRKTEPEEFNNQDLAFFAGTEGEKGAAVTYAEEAIKRGVTVIDNGADFRMDPNVPLVIPEINPQALDRHQGLIANPNCSTTIMLMALWPIYQISPIKRIVISTYQAVSGTGLGGVEELLNQVYDLTDVKDKGELFEAILSNQVDLPPPKVYPHSISFNLFPEIGRFEELGFSTEEWKTVKETHKILGDNSIAITATTVRVPIFNVHSEAIYIETEKKLTVSEVRNILSRAPGVKVIEPYPTPQMADGKDEVFVGRIREDPFIEKGLSFWVVGDNILKGAALNAVQIGEELIKRDLLKRTGTTPEERFRIN